MKRITHESILSSGRYRSLSFQDGEAHAAKPLLDKESFFELLDLAPASPGSEIPLADRMVWRETGSTNHEPGPKRTLSVAFAPPRPRDAIARLRHVERINGR